MYIAHSSPDGIVTPHDLKVHTKSVEKLASCFSKSFDPFAIAQVAALMHDQGKKSETFQAYIQSDCKVRGQVKHAIGGAIALTNMVDQDPAIIMLISLIVTGHHAGLANITDLNKKIAEAPEELKEIESLVIAEKKRSSELLSHSKGNIAVIGETTNLQWYFSTLTRFCLSSLADADWLDTEHYFNPNKSDLRTYDPPVMATFLPKLNRYMKDLTTRPTSIFLQEIRSEVYKAATKAAFAKDDFFTLHAPTGSGKTLASLSFALHHAKENDKRRIIFALPLTNVTEQTSKIYRSILGSEHVIEHHSQVEFENTSESMDKMRLATENWDRPFIVTTTVQLFESLFSNRTGKTRKLHRIADSIVVLDEYQKLPFPLLKPILSILKVLREQFNVTVLFMSATPLALEQSKTLPNIGRPIEILQQPQKMFKLMQRVDYKQIKQPLSTNDLVSKMKKHSSVLCIVNTKRDAQQIFEVLRKGTKCWDKIYHLSTTMCSNHRLQIIQEIKKLQTDPNNRESIAVVSTTIVEAGIDLDFDTVFRMYAPFDSIIQAAGRCNREANLDNGSVYLFDLIGSNDPEPFYAQSIQQTRNLLNRNGLSALQDPKACIQYFRNIYSNAGENGLDIHQLEGDKLFEFRQVAEDFKMINEDDSVSVLCVTYPSFPHQDYKQMEMSREWFRKMQQYMIQLNKRWLQSKEIEHENGMYIWQGKYDPAIGYTL